VYVLLDFRNRSQGKFAALVNRTEKAPVPGAVSGQAQQQASGFIGRSDRPLFKFELILLRKKNLYIF